MHAYTRAYKTHPHTAIIQLFKHVSEIQDRLDTAITFTLVNFFHDTLKQNIDDLGIYYLCFFAFFCAHAVGVSQKIKDTALSHVCNMTQGFSIMVAVQHISRTATSAFGASSHMHSSSMSLHIAAGYSVLLLSAIIPKRFLDTSFSQRSISLLLYILTDSTSQILNSTRLGFNGVLLSLLVIACIKKFSAQLSRPVLVYVLRLIDMITVNIMITSITTIDAKNMRVDVQAALMVVFLFCVDTIRSYDGVFENARNYAVWKISQQIFRIYRLFQLDSTILLYISVVVVMLDSLITTKTTTLTEVSLLLAVNQILDSIQVTLAAENNAGEYTLLLFYVILIHTTQEVFLGIAK